MEKLPPAVGATSGRSPSPARRGQGSPGLHNGVESATPGSDPNQGLDNWQRVKRHFALVDDEIDCLIDQVKTLPEYETARARHLMAQAKNRLDCALDDLKVQVRRRAQEPDLFKDV